ncbi:HK97 family phage prohead protease [Bradyrhizobium sp. CIR48]|uniref:HK97 family phage prohead protease n=1 Tax=Bradyrhizobium sp. CIR48 TaxID=2663840 RepID=UPI001605B742|nr:HK97 family phage prohead protease [Bradyrhizobium sp. CIR48]MBB4427098.1 HK97 family phage prohead protease [Bradyrhizobium sp. CIR48]
MGRWQRGYEIAANPFGLEYGGASGFITHIDGKRLTPTVEAQSPDDGRVLQGYACLYNKPVWNEGAIKSICPGAFDEYLATRPKVGFWLDHDEKKEVGDSTNGLELQSDDRGLAFRFRFPDTSLGRAARQLALDREYTGMSVGFTFRNDHVVDIEGEKVSLVKNAHLREISFVRSGAIDAAFGVLVQPSNSLKDALPSLPWDGAARDVMRALQKVSDAFEQDRR